MQCRNIVAMTCMQCRDIVTKTCMQSRDIVTKAFMQCRDIVPLGQNKSNFNYNLDEKRVLNFENIVNDSDNVKQDMSIDVYGRKQEGEEESSTPADTKDDKVSIPYQRLSSISECSAC